MKRLTLFLFVYVFSLTGFSQDTIFTRKNNTILSKVLEVKPQEIMYKKFENLDGPVYTLSKSLVEKIVYKNGSIDVFNEPQNKEEADGQEKSKGEANGQEENKEETDGQEKNKEDADGQEKNKGQMIIHIGATYSSFRGDVSSTKRILGFTGGFSAEVPVDKSFQNYIDLTFLYEQKGTGYSDQQVEISGAVYDGSDMTEIHEYLTFALTYKRYFSKRQIFFGRVGLFGGYLYEAKAKGSFQSLDGYVQSKDRSVKEFYSQTDFGASIGLGVNIPLQTGKYKSSFVFDARYNMGLSDIFPKPDNAFYSVGNIFTSDFVAMIGFRFPF